MLIAPDVEAMRAIGAAIAAALVQIRTPVTITLDGELGAGKTTLVGAVLNAFGFAGHARSPTYTLIEPYHLAGRSIYHLDLYRLVDPQEVEPLGLRDLLESGSIFLIEWPERGAGMLPCPDLAISIRYEGGKGRALSVQSSSPAGESMRLALVALTNL